MNLSKTLSCILLAFAITAVSADKSQAFYGFRCFGSCGVSGGCGWGSHQPVRNTLHAAGWLAGGAIRGTLHLVHGSARIVTAPVRGLAHHWGCGGSACGRGNWGHACIGCSGGCSGEYSGGYEYSGDNWIDSGDVIYENGETYGVPIEGTMEGPVELSPPPSEVVPSEDASAFAAPANNIRLASFQHPQAPSFADGLHAFWAGELADASRAFAARAHADATDPLSLYFLALTQRQAGNQAAAETTLAAAIEREASHPVVGWGKQMQRVQGSARLWVEKGRSSAHLGR